MKATITIEFEATSQEYDSVDLLRKLRDGVAAKLGQLQEQTDPRYVDIRSATITYVAMR